ncbi:SGNH/GDSL hydrolase family protein [uncultured Desulfosarcina sp.]|uniref:SGNH/GDSL hydrolase family protein n=1 Tax=uncultured Desulfosarcina sp. TaxID=218289 RepID=UPI0029C77729|nr:SGNH/GDSL hydrolase family protein [uncultured Desulfosarcina sp.]
MSHVVLLGDSIFDNASYVPGKPAVIDQLRHQLGNSWQATLLAIDGNVSRDVQYQTKDLPEDASHLIVSCGGNDALQTSSILYEPADSVAEALSMLTDARLEFQSQYNQMLKHVMALKLPTAVCTIYDSIPDLEPIAVTALSIFNDVIIREAISVGFTIIDLRLTCNDARDYSPLSPIEPSAVGGQKIVNAICQLLRNHDFGQNHSAVYF